MSPPPQIPLNISDKTSAVLAEVANQHASAQHPASYLAEIKALLGDALPELEDTLQRAARGDRPLDDAALNLLSAGGKRVRPLSTLLMTGACGGKVEDAVPLAASVELIHAATLLHDDVMDEGEERRGRPTSRVLFGNLVSVLSGDLVLTHALRLVQQADVPGVMEETLSAMQALISGEVAQLHARGRDDLGLDGYLEIVRGKTASLFSHACRSGARAARASEAQVVAAGVFGERVGIAFQVIDDVLDLEGVPHEVGKRLGHDLSEGKTTLPLAYALQDDAMALRPLLVDARTGDTVAAARVAQMPSVRSGCERAREFAQDQTAAGLAALGELSNSDERRLLESLVVNLIERRH